MIKELYQQTVREVCLNVSAGRVDSLRKKNITKSGCRVYDNGYIGVAGCLGQPTADTWAAAEQALERKVEAMPPETGKERVREQGEALVTPEAFRAGCEELLATLRAEFPDFVLSNKLQMMDVEMRLENDAGLKYADQKRSYAMVLLVKQAGSPNMYDSHLLAVSRRFDREGWLAQARQVLTAQRTLLPMPEGGRCLILDNAIGDALQNFSILDKALSGREYLVGTSLFQGRLGQRLFDPRVTLSYDVTGTEWLDRDDVFFDKEGTTLPGDRANLIENGVLKNLATNKKYAAQLGLASTGGAFGDYDSAPALDALPLVLASTGETLEQLTAGRECILPLIGSGGEWTDAGDYATPVQCAYLYRDGKLVGRLPEFGLAVKLDELFGENFVGVSTDRFLGERRLVFEGTVQ